ncbi:hypothetical protein TSAR_016058 [Trichomalopsis sarcophagae]|uniref:Uncharacterized protein n=1 Tax=Trichomalopsis sarcophagae TaxID=543379 RepID=A0A232F8X8_9HYME|nr:hypothetical protein TSAR_016058 [Trichomalopsis sarcophagae]
MKEAHHPPSTLWITEPTMAGLSSDDPLYSRTLPPRRACLRSQARLSTLSALFNDSDRLLLFAKFNATQQPPLAHRRPIAPRE